MDQDSILVSTDTPDRPELRRMAAKLKISLDICLARWLRLWCWIQRYWPDGRLLGASLSMLDEIAGVDGFAAALCQIDWLREIEGGLEVPNYRERWGRAAKSRWLGRERKRRQRRSPRASDAASSEPKNLSTEAGPNVTETGQARDNVTPMSRSGHASVTLGATDLLRSSPSLESYLNSKRARAARASLDMNSVDWEKAKIHANKTAKWVTIKRAKETEDRSLIFTACVLAQLELDEAWLWEALEAVKRKAGPINAAAFFRASLIRGLQRFVGPRDPAQLQAVYRELESRVTIPEAYLHPHKRREKVS